MTASLDETRAFNARESSPGKNHNCETAGLSQKNRESRPAMHVFVRMPNTKQTLPLALTGKETHADLCQKVRNLTKFPCALNLSYEGRPLTSAGDLQKNATIIAAATGLRGGMSDSNVDENAHKPKAGDTEEEKSYAKFVINKDIYPDVLGLEYTPTVEHGSQKPPPIITMAESETITIEATMKKFEDSFEKDKGEQDSYIFNYYFVRIVGNDPEHLVLDKTDPETYTREIQKPLKKQFAEQLKGGEITVHIHKSDKSSSLKDLPAKTQFLKMIPFIKNKNALKAMEQQLRKPQIDLMERFIAKEMEEEDLQHILNTMTDDQLDNMLLEFQTNHNMKILCYLLVKAKQWTGISQKMLNNASEETKTFQARHLINSLCNTFSIENEDDKIITELLKEEQATLIDGIIKVMSDTQLIELFLQILASDKDQHAQIINIIDQEDICAFWNKLHKSRKQEIFLSLPKEDQFEFIAASDKINVAQSQQLWDIIGREKRREIWRLSNDPDVQQKLTPHLAQATAKLQPSVVMPGPAANSIDSQQKAPAIPAIPKLGGLGKGLMLGTLVSSFKAKALKSVDKFKTHKLRRWLLETLTYKQQACLWQVLDGNASQSAEDEQKQLLKMIVEDNAQESVVMWNMLNHDKRCLFINQLEENTLKSVFLAMDDLESQSTLLLSLTENVRDSFKEALPVDRKKELFYYRHFSTQVETKMSSEDFITNLLEDHYSKNNQIVPFEKLEDGYVQCIENPQVKNGFITVQVVEPNYKVSNKETADQIREEDVIEEEKNTIIVEEKYKNDRFQLTQNHYGQIKEVEPAAERNAKKLGLISFFEYTAEHGILCTHTFMAPNPIACHENKTNDVKGAKQKRQHSNQIVLYTGLNGDVFFFNKKFDIEKNDEKNFDICLQIINREQNPDRGEMSRQTSECCYSYLVHPDTELHDFLMSGRAGYKNYTPLFMINQVPTMIEENSTKYVVFQHTPLQKSSDKENTKNRFLYRPALYFYDVDKAKEVKRIKGGEALINYASAEETNDENQYGRLMFMGNGFVMKANHWKDDVDKEGFSRIDAAKLYEESVEENRSAVVISLLVKLKDDSENNNQDLIQDNDGCLLEGSNKMPKLISNTPNNRLNAKVFPIDMEDNEKIFEQRYLRNNPVIIQPHGGRSEDGVTKAFTILFQHICAFTLSHIEVSGDITPEGKAKLAEEEAKNRQQIQQANDNKDAALVQKLKKEKSELKKNSVPRYTYFKCKYFVPHASSIVQETKKGVATNTYVQVSIENQKQKMKAKDSLKDQNEIDLFLFNVSDTLIKFGAIEKIPSESDTKTIRVPISREALLSYLGNKSMNKKGDGHIYTCATPIIFTKTALVGAFIYRMNDVTLRPTLDWFISPIKDDGAYQIVRNTPQSSMTDYPIMVYKGYMTDNRELVMINLANQKSPQKIIHLHDMQFICFVNHNNAMREARIGMLCLREGFVKLCWLVYEKTYQHRGDHELNHLSIVEIDIVFILPILDKIGSIKNVEFINEDNRTIDESNIGALLIQTTDDIWFSSNQSGYYENITMGSMRQVQIQRGFNSFFYFAQKSGDSDDIVNELKLSIIGQEWQCLIQEVHKINEGKVIALEIDPDNREKTDSVYTYKNQLIEEQLQVLNKIFVIDDKETMFHIEQRSAEESGARYIILNEKNLSNNRPLTQELIKYKKKPFNRVAVTNRAITLNDKNYNFANDHEWKLDVSRNQQNQEVLSKQQPEENDDEEEDNQVDGNGKKGKIPQNYALINKVKMVRWTSRQQINATYLDYNIKSERYKASNCVITKLAPGSRRQDLIGLRGLRDIDSINMISNHLFLLRFRGSKMDGTSDYWTLVNNFGQILPLPDKTKEHLVWSNFLAGESRMTRFGAVVVLRGGQKSIISIKSDVEQVERRITKLNFDRKGEVSNISIFRKTKYDNQLRVDVLEQLQTNKNLLNAKDQWKGVSEPMAQKFVDTLLYENNVLCSDTGDLYRIASIVVDDRFTNDVTVNPVQDPNNDKKDVDKLNVGIFVVSEKKISSEAKTTLNLDLNSKLLQQDNCQEMKIVLFLCKSKRDRFHLQKSGFVVINTNLCWSYPTETIVHILDLTSLNKKKVDKFHVFGDLLKTVKDLTGVKPKNLTVPKVFNGGDDDFKRVGTAGTIALIDDEDSASDILGPQIQYKPPSHQDFSSSKLGLLGKHVQMTQQKSFDMAKLALNNVKSKKTHSETEDESEGEEMATKISWQDFETRTIDLYVMCDNDGDKYCMKLTESPKSFQFSESKDEEIDFNTNEPKILKSLLQVTVKDRLIIYNIEQQEDVEENSKIQELVVFNATRQFMDPENFVESGFQMVQSYEDPSVTKDGYLVDQITQNRSKDLCFQFQERINYDRQLVFDNLPKTAICRGIFKKYAEIDLQELNRIQHKISKQNRLDNLDFQSMLSIYKGHSAFSIFAKENRFHEQMLIQVQETDFEDERQEDETELENNQLRRLYRVLILPTPEMNPENAQTISKSKCGDEIGTTDALMFKSVVNLQQNTKLAQLEEIRSPTEKPAEIGRNRAMSAQDEPKQEDKNEQDIDNNDKGKKEVQPESTKQMTGLQSVLKKSIFSQNARIKDCLLTITNKCSECSIGTFCDNQEAFGELLKDLSSNAIELIGDSFIATPFTKRIMNTNWHPDMEPTISMRLHSTLLKQEDVDLKIKELLIEKKIEEKEFTKAQVEVRLLDLTWLLADRKTFVDFISILDEASNDQIYTTELIKDLLIEFWDENFMKIVKKCLLPWVCYAFCAMGFFIRALSGEREDTNRIWINILGGLALVGLFYQLFIELRQSKNDTFYSYVTNVVNMMDMFQYLSTLWIISINMLGFQIPGRETQRVLASLSTLVLWIKVLDWCQLFGPTSFFIKLITETIYDIRHFFIIFVVALFMFGTPMYILQLNRDEDNAVVEEILGSNWILNALYNQYMLSLGEFTIDAFDSGPQVMLCYVFFLCATFFTQITFLNMLIALMGDTYGKVMESQETYALQTQRSIMNDYTAVINDPYEVSDFRPFMFVISQKLDDSDDSNSAWEGNLTVIKKAIAGGLTNLQKQLDKKLNAVAADINSQQSRDARFDKESRGQYVKIMERFASFDYRLNQIDVDKTAKIFDIVSRSQAEQKRARVEIQGENIDGQNQIVNQIRELSNLHEDSNQTFQRELQHLQESQKELIQAHSEQKAIVAEPVVQVQQPMSNVQAEQQQDSNAVSQSAKDAAQKAGHLEQVIAESSRNSDLAITRLGEQQQSILNQLSDLKNKSAEDTAAQSVSFQQVIAESSQNSDRAIAVIAEQQQSMFQQISDLKNNQDSLVQTISTSQANQSQFKISQDQLSEKINETQATLMQQLEGMRDDIRVVQQQQANQPTQPSQPQPAVGQGDNQQILDSMQAMMQQFSAQMTQQQQQSQQAMVAQQQADSQKIIDLLNPSETF